MIKALTTPILSIACVFLVTKLNFVSAANEVLFVLNHGFTSSAGAACSASEHSRINAIFTSRRALRGSDSSSMDNSTGVEDNRELFLRKCLDICKGYAPSSCHAKGCLGFGRDLAENKEADQTEKGDQESEGDRNLQVSCSTEMNNLHWRLDQLMNQVSHSCRNFMARDRRRATCFPDYRYGNIQGIRLWRISGSNQYLHTNFVAPGGSASFCKSTFINIETLTEPCVESVRYDMWGPNNFYRGHDEVEAPYALWGDDGTVLKGKYLSAVGWYTVWMAPDHDWSKPQWFDIYVANC